MRLRLYNARTVRYSWYFKHQRIFVENNMSYCDEFDKFYRKLEDPYQTGRLLSEKIRLAKTFELIKSQGIYKLALDVGCGEGHIKMVAFSERDIRLNNLP